MRYIVLALFLVGCGEAVDHSDPGPLVPFAAYQMNPGERLIVAHFTAADGDNVSFVVLGSNLQPMSVAVGYEGPHGDPELHHSYAWFGAGQASPYADATPAPLVAGAYNVTLGCEVSATLPCVFGFAARRTRP